MHGRAERYLRGGERESNRLGRTRRKETAWWASRANIQGQVEKILTFPPLSGPEDASIFARMKEHYTSLISRILNVPNR